VGHLGAYVRFESDLSGAIRELAILATARVFDCLYEWAFHQPLARDEGVDDEAIDVVATRGSIDGLDETETTVVDYGRQLFDDHRVTDATFAAARETFGVRGVTELTATIGYYAMLACVLNAFEVLPDEETPLASG
jgi:4-carboxymuconolactone decarboxylase